MNYKKNCTLGIKRWIVIGIIGLMFFIVGFSPLYNKFQSILKHDILFVISIIIGGLLLFISVKFGILTLLTVINQYKYEVDINTFSVKDMVNKKKVLNKGPKIVVLGGGTGLSVLLRGLKEYTSNITAIVTVADDGGGSGILREDLGMLPPGDIRSCILALADTEPTMEKLLQYRFKEGNLKGQSFGNLFIAAMNGIYENFDEAIKEMSNVLAVSGKVLPMTLENVILYAKLSNKKVIKGESNIPEVNKKVGSKIEKVFIKPNTPRPLEESIEAIKKADIVLLGPGSLYTSVIPNILVKDIVKELEKSKARKIYISNVMTQPGETEGYSVKDHVKAIIEHGNDNIIDYVITNTEGIPDDILKKYSEDGSEPVILNEEDEEYLYNMGIKVVKSKLIDIKKDYIRHDATELSKIIINMYNEGSDFLKYLLNKIKKEEY